MAKLHTIAKQDVRALVASGGIDLCSFVLTQEKRDEAWSKALGIWSMCAFNFEYLNRILKLGGVAIASDVLDTFSQRLYSWPDLVAASVILVTGVSLLNDKEYNKSVSEKLIEEYKKNCRIIINVTFKIKKEMENDFEIGECDNREEKLGLLNNCLLYVYNLCKYMSNSKNVKLLESYMLSYPKQRQFSHQTFEDLCIDLIIKPEAFSQFEFALNPTCKILTIWLQNKRESCACSALTPESCATVRRAMSFLKQTLGLQRGSDNKTNGYKIMVNNSLGQFCDELSRIKERCIRQVKKKIKF